MASIRGGALHEPGGVALCSRPQRHSGAPQGNDEVSGAAGEGHRFCAPLCVFLYVWWSWWGGGGGNDIDVIGEVGAFVVSVVSLPAFLEEGKW